MNIEINQRQFIEDMSEFRSDLISALSSVNVERYRTEYKGRFSAERFKEYFHEKVALHTLFKYLLIRMIEESMGRVKVKLNKVGLNNWHEMSKNFRQDYDVLFKLAENDVKREKDLNEIFKDTIYDDEEFTNKSLRVLAKHIPLLAKYNFKTLDAVTTLALIDSLYGPEKREKLQDFYQPSKITNFLLGEVGLI